MGKLSGLIFVAVLMEILWICGDLKAQTIPVQHGINRVQETQSPSNHDHAPGQRRNTNNNAEENAFNQIPKPERNRLYEGCGKKSSAKRGEGKKLRKRKKADKQATVEISLSEKDVETKPDSTNKSGSQLTVTNERIDDIPLLIEVMVKMGLVETLDRHIPFHWKQRDLSWGWTTVIWLAYILSEGDHRKVNVREYISGMVTTLKQITGKEISELDFTDDRLSILVKYLSCNEYWEKIESELSEITIEAFDLENEIVRCDATTVSGYHQTTEDGIFQYGISKDDPTLPQMKIMMGSLDPLGMPLATEVVSGEKADDKLYTLVIGRIDSILNKKGVLYVGDCKLSSFDNRLYIKGRDGHYLSPLANTGKTAGNMPLWINEGIRKDLADELVKFIVTDEKGGQQLKAKGYEINREQSGVIDGKQKNWEERVLIVNSPAHAKQMEEGLERRLSNAEAKIHSLTPARGRGKRQITDESELIGAVKGILKAHKVTEFIDYEYKREVEHPTKYKGRGRGSATREQVVIEKVRYQITKVIRQEDRIEAEKKWYGWKAFVTDVSKARLSFIDVVQCYRKEYRIERNFNRLKSRLNIAPFFVKKC